MTESESDSESAAVAKRVLFVGWQGAEATALARSLDSGRLASLSTLIERGAQASLAVPRPSFTDAVWTSVATGRRPHEHGVLCPVRLANGTPVSWSRRRAPAIWRCLHDRGLHTHCVGWPATHPAEALLGVHVSDQFRGVLDRAEGPSILPTDVAGELAAQCVAPWQVKELTVGQLLPDPTTAPAELRESLYGSCQALLAESASLFRMFRWALDHRPWTFAACVFPGLGRAHLLAEWLRNAAPRSTEVADDLVAGAYEHHDMLLGQLLLSADDDTLVATLAPVVGSSQARDGSSRAGRDTGLAVFCGAGARQAPLAASASVLDVAPTVLAALGAPVDPTLPGRPLAELFGGTLKVGQFPSRPQVATPPPSEWSAVFASARPQLDRDPAVEHLLELGYVDPDQAAFEAEVVHAERQALLNCAISQADASDGDGSLASLDQLVDHSPEWAPGRLFRAERRFHAGHWTGAREDIDWLVCHGVESVTLYQLAAALDCVERRLEDAYENVRCAQRTSVPVMGLQLLAGEVHLRRRDLLGAMSAFGDALVQGGHSAPAHAGLAVAHLWADEPEEAAMHALEALAADLTTVRAHYALAAALVRLGRLEDAKQAVGRWALVAPTAAAPRRVLATLYAKAPVDPSRAEAEHAAARRLVRERRERLKASRGAAAAGPSSRP